MPAYIRTAFFVTSAVDRATRPLLKEFDDAAFRRDRALASFRYMSPAIITHSVFNEIAGSSAARHRHYIAQARELKAAYSKLVAPYIVAGQRLPSSRADALPRFALEDSDMRTIVTRAAPALLTLVLATSAFLLGADRRLRRFRMFG